MIFFKQKSFFVYNIYTSDDLIFFNSNQKDMNKFIILALLLVGIFTQGDVVVV